VQARPEVRVKLLPQEQELYVYVESQSRISKERAMRRRKLKWFWKRLKELQRQRPIYETLMMKIGAARSEVGQVASLVNLILPDPPPKSDRSRRVDFGFTLARAQFRVTRRREGRYCCAPTSPIRIQPNCGSFICSWGKSKRLSGI
jgi:hypothetical protein